MVLRIGWQVFPSTFGINSNWEQQSIRHPCWLEQGLLWPRVRTHVLVTGEGAVFMSSELITSHKVVRGPLCSSTQG